MKTLIEQTLPDGRALLVVADQVIGARGRSKNNRLKITVDGETLHDSPDTPEACKLFTDLINQPGPPAKAAPKKKAKTTRKKKG